MDEMSSAGTVYLDMGLVPFPLCGPRCPGHKANGKVHDSDRGGKVPLVRWAFLRAHPPSREDVARWAVDWPGHNLGLALGGPSNLVAWDRDGDAGADCLRRLIGSDPPPSWSVATGRGFHDYYRWPDGTRPAPAHWKTGHDLLSFLSHGSYTVAPPSVHRSGTVYRWRPGCAPWDRPLTVATPAMVGAILARRGVARKRGGVWASIPRRAADAKTLKRARAYARTQPGGTKGAGGRARAWSVAVDVAGKFGLGEDDLVVVLAEEWGPNCSPPWTDKEHLRFHIGRAADLTVVPLLGERPAVRQSVDKPKPAPPRPVPVPVPKPSTSGVPFPVVAPAPPVDDPNDYAAGNSRQRDFILLSEAKEAPLGWLEDGWIPLGTLTLICGPASSGKSTYGAHLAALAGRTVLLPEPGEDLWRGPLARMRVHGVDPATVRVLRGADWTFPLKRDRLADHVRDHRAKLVWIDPADSYMSGCSMNVEEEVRPMLESLAWVAVKTGAAVVCARHPGKDPTNINPGSMRWGTIPRCVLEIVVQSGPPIERIMRVHRDSNNVGQSPRRFSLVGERRQPMRWMWTVEVDADTVDAARIRDDAIDRWKLQEAIEWLRDLLSDGPVETCRIFALGLREGFNDRMLRRAYKEMGLFRRRHGSGQTAGAKWSLEEIEETPDTPDTPDSL